MKFTQVPSTAELSNLSRGLLLARSPFQEIIDNAIQVAGIYRSVGSMTNDFSKMLASLGTAGISHELFRSFELPKNSLQSIIEAGSRLATMGNNLRSLSLAASKSKIANLTQLHVATPLHQISKVFELSLAAGQVLRQSAGISSLVSRVIRETEFRQAFMERLESENLTTGMAAASEIPTERILEVIERGIEESGVVQQSENIQTSLNRMFSGWAKLPPDLRNFAILLVVGILLFVIEHSIFEKSNPSLQITVNQRVKIVQQITNNILINVNITSEDRRQIRIVSTNDLPVFRSDRRDSEKVATLSVGQVVTIKRKSRNWTQVEWWDANMQEVRTGWVFSRYLKKV